MQQLKQEIEMKIIVAGRKEFLAKGFVKATVRDIARRAGISLGNFYTYFKGKEDLFVTIVEPVHQRMNKLMMDFFNYEAGKNFRDADFVSQFISHTAMSLTFLIQNNRKDVIMLLDKGVGTPYEGYKMQLVHMIEQDFKEDLRAQNAEHTLFHTPNGALFLIAKNLIEGIIETAKHVENEEDLSRTLRYFIHYHLNGMVSLLEV